MNHDWHSGDAVNWNEGDGDIAHYVHSDLTHIFTTMEDTLSQIADQLQFVWRIKRTSESIIIKVKEEGDEENEYVMPYSNSNNILVDEEEE